MYRSLSWGGHSARADNFNIVKLIINISWNFIALGIDYSILDLFSIEIMGLTLDSMSIISAIVFVLSKELKNGDRLFKLSIHYGTFL